MNDSASFAVRDQQRMALAKNYFAWQSRLILRELGSRVVEVGCGIGNFTGMLLKNREVLAIEIEPNCVKQTRLRYSAAANLQVLVGDWGAADWQERLLPSLAAFRPDSCVCLNVLEHIEDDREALRRMASILEPGGVIVLLVPAFPALYGPIDKRLRHCRRYVRKELRALVGAAGLEIRSLHYMNSLGFFGWWVNAHMLKREEQSAKQIAVFDRYIVPLASRIEGLVHPPFGQSLLAVLRK